MTFKCKSCHRQGNELKLLPFKAGQLGHFASDLMGHVILSDKNKTGGVVQLRLFSDAMPATMALKITNS